VKRKGVGVLLGERRLTPLEEFIEQLEASARARLHADIDERFENVSRGTSEAFMQERAALELRFRALDAHFNRSMGQKRRYARKRHSLGDVVTGGDGKPWRVQCMSTDGNTLGLVPATLRGRVYWWLRLRGWI
jgi:hypothetical protein